MKYKLLDSGNPGSRDVTAFYGLNRTGAISDFQLSDMENMDCEDFPYVKTRRSRIPFWGADDTQSPMEMICSDTDVYDDYKVTGVTKNGGFVYRGEKLLASGYSGNTDMIEHMGDYVFLPTKKVVTAGDGIATESEFNSQEGGFLGDYLVSRSNSYSNNFLYNQTAPFYMTKDRICLGGGSSYAFPPGFEEKVNAFYHFFFQEAAPGRFFTLGTFCRNGSYDNSYNLITEGVHKGAFPDDVVMVIDDVYYLTYGTDRVEKKVSYGSVDFTYDKMYEYFSSVTDNFFELYITFTARKITTGELYDISSHFELYNGSDVIVSEDVFRGGIGHIAFNSGRYYWNDFHVSFVTPTMLFGASYGGRLFTCDNLGVTIYGSSATRKYDFEATGSAGGAVFLSCADPGKWTGICPYGDALYVFKRNGMYRIYSGDGLTFYMDRIADVGAIDKSSVCVVDDVMYFLSDEGLYQFSGAYPQLLPNALGKRYIRGTLGGDDRKLFASLTYSEGGEEKTELIVYHADKQIYSRHDDFAAKQILVAMGGVYALSPDGVVYQLEGERNSLSFSLTTKKYFFGFSKKAANAARLFFTYEPEDENDSFLVEIAYDDGGFEPCGAPIKNGRARYVPIRFRKCDEFTLKVSGKGVFALKGLSFAVYQGGDIKQNHMIK